MWRPFGEAARSLCRLAPELIIEAVGKVSTLPVDEREMLGPADVDWSMATYGTDVCE